MNKKYTTLAIAGLLALNTVAFGLPVLTADQEKARLAMLWNLKANNALTIAQFVENGHSADVVIERDMALLEKDMVQALQQKSWAEGFISNKMVPGMLKGIAIGSVSLAALGALFSGAGTLAAYKVWNTDNDTKVSYSGFVTEMYLDLADRRGVRFKTAAEKRADKLVDDHPDDFYNFVVLTSGLAAPLVAVASLLSAGISKYTFNKNASWNKKNADFIQEMQNRANTNQAIIAILKQLKYDNNL